MEYINLIKSTMRTLLAMAILSQFAVMFTTESSEKNGVSMIIGLCVTVCLLKLIIKLIYGIN